MAERDSIIEFIEKHGLKRDRETYLQIAFLGSPPDELSPEDEADMPPEFRKGQPGDWEEFD
jgi:hypothetical protein